jgi:hypothetical protein
MYSKTLNENILYYKEMYPVYIVRKAKYRPERMFKKPVPKRVWPKRFSRSPFEVGDATDAINTVNLERFLCQLASIRFRNS